MEEQGKKKKGIVKWIVIGVVAVFILAAIFGNDDSDSPTKTGEVAETSSETGSGKADDAEGESSEDSDDKSSSEKKTAKKEGDGKYHPGDVVKFGDFKIVYKSAKKYKSNNQFIQPKSGYQYVKFDFAFKNEGDADSFVGDFACYADGEKCEREYVDESGSDFLVEELSSGRKVSGSLVFEVPKKTSFKNIELEYENYDLFSDKKAIFVAK